MIFLALERVILILKEALNHQQWTCHSLQMLLESMASSGLWDTRVEACMLGQRLDTFRINLPVWYRSLLYVQYPFKTEFHA